MTLVFSDYLPGTLGTDPQFLADLTEREPLLTQFERVFGSFITDFREALSVTAI
jgi:hypothetical protein